jgi:hypothetical protein
VLPDPPKKASLEGVPELGLCKASFVDLVDAFRRKMSLNVAESGTVDDFRLLELENLKLPRVIAPPS